MKRLSDMFGEIDNAAIRQRISEAGALAAWEEVVGELISSNAEPLYIRSGTLYVRTKSPSWSQELTGLAPSIIQKINVRLRRDIVKEIRFVSGPLLKKKYPEDEEKALAEQAKLSPEELQDVRSTAENIHEDDLKDAFTRLMIKDREREKWLREQDR